VPKSIYGFKQTGGDQDGNLGNQQSQGNALLHEECDIGVHSANYSDTLTRTAPLLIKSVEWIDAYYHQGILIMTPDLRALTGSRRLKRCPYLHMTKTQWHKTTMTMTTSIMGLTRQVELPTLGRE
jgi:hypothetical protein